MFSNTALLRLLAQYMSEENCRQYLANHKKEAA
jgi:hypothetical protein